MATAIEEMNQNIGEIGKFVNPNPPIHTGGRREDSGRV